MKKQKKCADCPYRLGRVQCVKDPCPACRASGRKRHPFAEPQIVHSDSMECGLSWNKKRSLIHDKR